jgi:hypothetical protein
LILIGLLSIAGLTIFYFRINPTDSEVIPESASVDLEPVISNYAPRIWIHPDEKFPPTDPLEFVKRSSLWQHRSWLSSNLIAPRGSVVAENLNKLGDSYFLKLEDSQFFGQSLESVPIFWRLGSSEVLSAFGTPPTGHRWIFVEYWYHLAFSRGWSKLGDHQGDWEGMAILVETSEKAPWEDRPLILYFAAHEGGTWQCPSEVTWVAPDAIRPKHPVAYSALGSHATYSSDPFKENDLRSVVVRDRTAQGQAWDTWKVMRPLVSEPYYGFGGAWGDYSVNPFMCGPLIPGIHKSQPKHFDKNASNFLGLRRRCRF